MSPTPRCTRCGPRPARRRSSSITGNVPTDRFLAMATVARRSARVVLVRVWPTGDRLPGVLPGAKVLDVDSLDHFHAAWATVTT